MQDFNNELVLIDLFIRLAEHKKTRVFNFDELSSLLKNFESKKILLDELEEFYRCRIIDFNEPGTITSDDDFNNALRNEELLLTEQGVINLNNKLKEFRKSSDYSNYSSKIDEIINNYL